MSRKDYTKFAEAIKNLKFAGFTDEQRYLMAHELCRVFKSDNSSFKRGRFLEACDLPLRPEDG
jgi:hypothetical protein